MKIKPDDYWVLLKLALMKKKQCLYRDAIEYFEQLAKFEEKEEIYQHLNICHQILGNHQQAQYYQEKITLLNE